MIMMRLKRGDTLDAASAALLGVQTHPWWRNHLSAEVIRTDGMIGV
jgi:hypothetical protein